MEIGTGLNTRFDRVDNGQVHWIDLDLPDTIELRRRFFTDSGRRRMVAASVLDEDWLPAVRDSPGPYFFVADGVLTYLEQAPEVIARIAREFPGALIAFDTYSQRTLEQQHRLAARKNMDARWAWSCDDPRTLESLGLEIVQEAAVTRPPPELRRRLPRRYRWALPLAHRIVGDLATVTLFRAAGPSHSL
jgi:O-methyltransferase involved in polyketide biosynthesis